MNSRLCTRWLPGIFVVGTSLLGAPVLGQAEEVNVTVVTILATNRDTHVDRELKCVALEIQKKDPTLTGFRMGTTKKALIAVGQKETFPLVDKEEVTILVRHGANAKKWVGLSVWPPQMGRVCYSTCCTKFFPIITGYTTNNSEVLVIAISACPSKKQQ